MIRNVIAKNKDPRILAQTAKNLAKVGKHIGIYAAQASLGKLSIKDHQARLDFFKRNVGKHSRAVLDLMNVDVKVYGYDPKRMLENNYLMVSNHLSYLDILVMSSVHPTVFVTSVDMGEQFFLGDMAEMGGSIFIERRHRGQIDRDLNVISETLRAGHDVMIYPEGTSGNGLSVLPFKKSLLMSAVDAQVDIMPVVIKYSEINGEPFNASNADNVCWHGDMDFVSHFLNAVGLKSMTAELHFLEPITVTKDSTRQELAEKAYSAIHTVYMGAPPETVAKPAQEA